MASRRLALIDADIYAYTAAATGQESFRWPDAEAPVAVQTSDLADTIRAAEESVLDAAAKVKASRTIVCLSCPSAEGFRVRLLPTYKAGRVPKPLQLAAVKDHYRSRFECMERPLLEADDLLGLLATSAPERGWETVLVSGDKDLRQIPGNFYDPIRGILGRVDEEAGLRLHALQTLTGDPVDNYSGCPGIGPVKAAKLLTTPDGAWYPPNAWWPLVVSAYEAKGLTEDDALVQARVAFILRKGYYNDQTGEVKLWQPPSEN
jgi:DNA polymerase-1